MHAARPHVVTQPSLHPHHAPPATAAASYDQFHALLHKKLDEILRVANPRRSVMIAVDGPAPLAKLITQRERRQVRPGQRLLC